MIRSELRQLSSRLPLAAGVLILLAVITVAPVCAYLLEGQTWVSSAVGYRINPNFPSTLSGTDDQQVDTIKCAARAWRTQARAGFNFVFTGTTSVASVNTFDGTNAVFWSGVNPGGGTLAATFYSFDFADHFIGFDIVYYGQNDFGPLTWDGVGDTTFFNTDINGVGVHEFGHALGLDHPPVPAATMYAFYDGLEDRTLHSDDIAGARFLYGFVPSVDDNPTINNVEPASGPQSGGIEVTLTGDNFTWDADTIVRVDGSTLPQSFYHVDSPCTIRIAPMPAHLPGPVSIQVINELGSSVLDGAFTYVGPLPTGDGTIQILSVAGAPGQTGLLVPTLADHDFALAGYSYGVDFDANFMQIMEATVAGTDLADAEFVVPGYNNSLAPGGGWWTIGVVLDLTPPIDTFLPAGNDHLITHATYSVDSSAVPGSFLPMNVIGTVGEPAPVEIIFSIEGGFSVTPSILDGVVLVQDSLGFIRGDDNRDGSHDIADPIYTLGYLFSMGPTVCEDAQDTNDDGTIDIADPIYNLSFLFSMGVPPPAPFPGSGPDPTGDSLGCEN